MKKLIFTIAIAFIGSICIAQTMNTSGGGSVPVGSTTNCGWQYLYNQAGNRYARIFINCLPPAAGKTELEETPLAEIQLEINNVYPVPTGGTFTVEFSQAIENQYIQLYSIDGKLLYNEKHSGISVEIDISGYASGTYFLHLQNENTTLSKKIIKE